MSDKLQIHRRRKNGKLDALSCIFRQVLHVLKHSTSYGFVPSVNALKKSCVRCRTVKIACCFQVVFHDHIKVTHLCAGCIV